MLEQKIGDKKPLYSPTAAAAESNRCLFCHDAPCIVACPTAINIPRFIRQIATSDLKGAASTILSANILGFSCGCVCPVEVLCAGSCVYNLDENPPINIGRLQRYAVETAVDLFGFSALMGQKKTSSGKKIALIGSGPASLSAAALLTLHGHSATIFEKNSIPGGLNALGIAPYKLHCDEAQKEITWLRELGVKIRLNNEITGFLALKDFDAIFFGIGLGRDQMLTIPGLNGPGIFGAVDVIERIKSDPSIEFSQVKSAHVIGGGNTAIDIAHELKLLGIKQVTMLYHRREQDMSGYQHEMASARKSGVVLKCQQQLKEIIHHDQLAKELVIFDGVSNYKTNSDLVILAIGQEKLAKLALNLGVAIDKLGRIIVDPATGKTSHPIIWSGGDCVNGGSEVVNAVQEGKVAARSIHEYLLQLNHI